MPDPGDDGPAAHSLQPTQTRVVVTADFGANLLLDVTVALTGETTAIEALESVTRVDASYGDCFVESIEGVGDAGGGKTDWFYYINGILGDVGSCDYTLCDGDVQHWDYHDWRFRRDVTATLGVFPHAFMNGYGGLVRPTTVLCEPEFSVEAGVVAGDLAAAGVAEVAVVVCEAMTVSIKEDHNLVLIASHDNPLVSELYGVRDRVGLFTAFEDSTLVVYDRSGEASEQFGPDTGVIEAMQNPWNPGGRPWRRAKLLSGRRERSSPPRHT